MLVAASLLALNVLQNPRRGGQDQQLQVDQPQQIRNPLPESKRLAVAAVWVDLSTEPGKDAWNNSWMHDVAVLIGITVLAACIARANHLYGRSAFEAGEYGGPFFPSWLTRAAARAWHGASTQRR